MASICSTKHDIDNGAKALESTKGLLHCHKISRTLVHKRLKIGQEFLLTFTILFRPSPSYTHKRLKIGQEFLLTFTILFRPSPSYTLCAALTWRPTATLNETVLCLSAAQI